MDQNLDGFVTSQSTVVKTTKLWDAGWQLQVPWNPNLQSRLREKIGSITWGGQQKKNMTCKIKRNAFPAQNPHFCNKTTAININIFFSLHQPGCPEGKRSQRCKRWHLCGSCMCPKMQMAPCGLSSPRWGLVETYAGYVLYATNKKLSRLLCSKPIHQNKKPSHDNYKLCKLNQRHLKQMKQMTSPSWIHRHYSLWISTDFGIPPFSGGVGGCWNIPMFTLKGAPFNLTTLGFRMNAKSFWRYDWTRKKNIPSKHHCFLGNTSTHSWWIFQPVM